MRIALLALLFALPAIAGAPRPDPDRIRTGLLAAGRDARDEAEEAARRWARTDPGAVAALWEHLDLRGRCLLVRALASAGTRHAAEVGLKRAGGTADEEVFTALLEGLLVGGGRALFAPLPDGMPASRRHAVEALRLRWRVEAEFVRLKSPSGPTGHYEGQFKRVKAIGPAAIPILFDMVRDRARPLPQEGGAGPYRAIHPGMVRFDRSEVRQLAAHSFGEVVEPDDLATIERLDDLFDFYWMLDEEEFRLEKETLAPALAYALHDLGRPGAVEVYIESLEHRLNVRGGGLSALWDLGYTHIRIGNFEEGKRYYEQALQYSVSKALAAYNLACMYAMRARKQPRNARWFKHESLQYLTRAIDDHNYGDWKWMEEDGDLDAIRDEPRYRELLKKLQRRYPERRKGRVSKKREDFLGGK